MPALHWPKPHFYTMKFSKIIGCLAAATAAVAAVYWWAPAWLPASMQTATSASKSGEQAKAGGKKGGFGGPVSVNVEDVVLADLPITLQASGSIVALQSVVLRPQVSAVIQRVVVKEGSNVAAGALLFELDTRSVQADLAKAMAQLAKSQATLADLQRQLERAKDLKSKSFVSASAVDSAQSQVSAQQAQISADQAGVRAQQVQLSLYQVRAPFAGRIGAIDVSPGALVSAGSSATPLGTLTQFDPISVKFSLPESALSAVVGAGTGQAVGVRLASNNPGVDTSEHLGKLTLIDNLINPATGMLTLKATLANKEQKLWPGQFVDINLRVATLEAVATVAQSAIVLSETGASVFVMDAKSRALVKPIKVLHAMGDLAAVSGLAAGDMVVTDGRQNVKPGGMLRAMNKPKKNTSGTDSTDGTNKNAATGERKPTPAQ